MLYQTKTPFRYKGDRNYVHGPDVFDAMLKTVHDYFNNYPNEIKGSFHRFLQNDGIISIYDNNKSINYKIIFAFFSIILNEASYKIVITAAKNKVCLSYDYDEHKILENMECYDGEIKMILKSSYTYMEQIVAMTKKLHLTFYPLDDKNWLITKIHLIDAIDPVIFPGHMLSIKTEKNFHYRLTQNTIFLDDKFVGRIWFSKPAPEVS
jgi:hypothetical protein